jgi:hypothetical protein
MLAIPLYGSSDVRDGDRNMVDNIEIGHILILTGPP